MTPLEQAIAANMTIEFDGISGFTREIFDPTAPLVEGISSYFSFVRHLPINRTPYGQLYVTTFLERSTGYYRTLTFGRTPSLLVPIKIISLCRKTSTAYKHPDMHNSVVRGIKRMHGTFIEAEYIWS